MKKTITLIEVIVGVTLVVTVFTGIIASFIAARRYVMRANVRLDAANIARAELNKLYNAVRVRRG